MVLLTIGSLILTISFIIESYLILYIIASVLMLLLLLMIYFIHSKILMIYYLHHRLVFQFLRIILIIYFLWKRKLISITQIIKKRYSTLFESNIMKIYANIKPFRKLIIRGRKMNKLYILFAGVDLAFSTW